MRTYQVLAILAGVLIGGDCLPARGEGSERPKSASTVATTITVKPAPWGVSTRYVGGTEGNMGFDIKDLTDCGINTLRIYGDMSRFEAVDDDGVYGSPSVAEIKANPDAIPWSRWDATMDSPYSDQVTRTPPVTWRSLFADLKRAGVTAVISLRNRDAPTLRPEWMAAVPKSEADWNEWWEYVFAMAYWLNVRNDFRVDEYEVLNEPDNTPEQGWLGTREEYCEMVRRTKDALDYVYRTYLPNRTCHVHAPVTASPNWVPGVLADAGDSFDSFNIHWYAWWDQGEFVRKMHGYLRESGHPDYPVWLSEWGTYDTSYDVTWMGLAVVENLIRFSKPGDDYVWGSHVFSLYDWMYDGTGHWGIITREGERRATYYAMRLANRALVGGKPTFEVSTSHPELHAIATKNQDGRINLLVLNWDDKTSYIVTAQLSGLLSDGTGAIRQFSARARDVAVGQTALTNGVSTFTVPPWSAVLVTYGHRR